MTGADLDVLGVARDVDVCIRGALSLSNPLQSPFQRLPELRDDLD